LCWGKWKSSCHTKSNNASDYHCQGAWFKRVKGFQTGDIVKAIVTKGKKIGTYVGRVAVRATGSFDIGSGIEAVGSISYKYCQLLQRSDGYDYLK